MRYGFISVMAGMAVLCWATSIWAHFGMLITSDDMISQTIKADPNDVFTYAVPRTGWWGFAALNTADLRSNRMVKIKAWKLAPYYGSILNHGMKNRLFARQLNGYLS